MHAVVIPFTQSLIHLQITDIHELELGLVSLLVWSLNRIKPNLNQAKFTCIVTLSFFLISTFKLEGYAIIIVMVVIAVTHLQATVMKLLCKI